jgi:hypothetical protein
MMLYFFTLVSGGQQVADDNEGEQFPDDKSAHANAVVTAHELKDWEGHEQAIILVKAEDGRLVSEVPLGLRLQ